MLSAAGSLPASRLFWAKTCVSTRPRVSVRIAAHISTRRLCSELAGVWLMELGERVVGPPPLALPVRATSGRAEAFGEGGRSERLDENRCRPEGGAGDKRPARERCRHPVFLKHADLNRNPTRTRQDFEGRSTP